MQSLEKNYLQKILKARVYDVARETPLQKANLLSERISNTVMLKREDLQQVFSFKLRGAYNKIANLSPEARAKGVIAASAGNHAQGVALSAKKLGCRAVIVMPITAPALKINAVRRLGGEVVLYGDSFTDAANYALELQAKEGLTPVHPFDDPDVIAGQGTVAMEIVRQAQNINGDIDAVFVPVGGGGLLAGISVYIKSLYPEIKVFGVQTIDSDSMNQSLKAKKPILVNDVGLFSDGTAVKLVGNETFKLAEKFVDGIVLVSTDEVCAAIKDIFQDTRSIMEPAGALSVAGIKAYAKKYGKKGETYVGVLSGANINFDRLRFVAERAELGEHHEALFSVTIPEERGSFRKLIHLLNSRAVTEFNYRISDDKKAQIFVGVQIEHRSDTVELKDIFEKNGFTALDITDNELAKTHLRYMVGGHSDLATNERLLRFEFPERPGALAKFLSSAHPDWNISLFHYRNQGADYGRVLVGIQVPPSDNEKFNNFLCNLGYSYVEETDNPAYRLFLG
ncbi:MAG: threonine ammonia-lyase, biosynthetic [Burkholderiaceae bacterium]|nr:threonine ammonia-lyase, biosynthetic [Burkholderiaceae bacterium]